MKTKCILIWDKPIQPKVFIIIFYYTNGQSYQMFMTNYL